VALNTINDLPTPDHTKSFKVKNTDYWTDDTLRETLTTGQMIPSGKH
jgi:hypothetical protein